MAKKKDNEIQTNGFENRSDDFQSAVSERGEVYELIGDITDEETQSEFKRQGIRRIEKYAGEYATGDKYGSGVQEGKYDIRYASRTKTVIQKQIIYGTKRIETEIKMDFDPENDILKLSYDGTEKAVFRGHMNNDDEMGFMINDKATISTEDMKKAKKKIKDFFKACAKKEVGYLINTKLGIDDRLDTSLAGSVVEENTKDKTMDLNKLINSSPEDISKYLNNMTESIKRKIDGDEEVEINHPDVIDANTKGNLLFDELEEEEQSQYQSILDALRGKMYPESNSIKDLNSAQRSKLFDKVDDIWTSSEERAAAIEEITSAGAPGAPGTAGAFHYQSPHFLKKEKGKKKQFNETSYAKSKEGKPHIKKDKQKGDSFWTTVDVEMLKDRHPLGMPGVEVGSEEELNNSYAGGAANTKFWKIHKEGNELDLTKKKFFNESDNEKAGLNKRYLVTEKRSKEEQVDRWKRLSTFTEGETVRNAESVVTEEEKEKYQDYLKECGCDNSFDGYKDDTVTRDEYEEESNDEFESMNTDNEDDFVYVEKPDSMVVLKLKKNDFMNENANKFIFDYTTNNYVLNPKYENVINESKEDFSRFFKRDEE